MHQHKFLKIYILFFILTFATSSKAQQLIINPEFRLNYDTNSFYPFTKCSESNIDSVFNKNNCKSSIKAFTFGEKGYYYNLYSFGFHTNKKDTINYTINALANWDDTLIYPNIFSIMKTPHGYAYPSGYQYPLPQGLNSAIGRISMELTQKTIPNAYYFLRFYASIYPTVIPYYSSPLGYFPGIFCSSSSLIIGLTSVDSLFGNQILNVTPPIVSATCVTFTTPQKYTNVFTANDSSGYLTLMGDYDTAVFAIYQFRSFVMYPALLLGKRNVHICYGDSIKITSSIKGSKYDWTPPSSIASMVDTVTYYLAKDTGWYVNFIYRTDSVLVDSIHVLYNSVIINTTNDTAFCQGANIVLKSTSKLTGNKYLWNSGDTTSLIQVNNSGNFWVMTTINSICTKVDSFNVQLQNKVPLPLSSDTIFCKVGNYTLNAYNNSYNKYLWNTNDTTSSITISNSGNYFVTASNNICKTTDSINVQIINLPAIKIKDTSFCIGSSLLLDATNNSYKKYLWNTSDTTSSIKIFKQGLYIISASNNICFVVDSINVLTYSPKPLYLTKDTALCQGNILSIDAKNIAYNNYQWNTGEATSKINITQPGKYIVTATNGICTIEDSINVKTNSLPQLHLTKDTVICFDDIQKVVLDAGKFKSYYWYPTGETSETIYATVAEQYVVIVTDTNNCINKDTTLVEEKCGTKMYIPNAFTPNGDGINDIFYAYSRSSQSFEMKIYNRWGEQIFSTTDILKGWDGTFQNIPCISDTYVWQINYTLKGATSSQTASGNVQLLK